jgi:enamine deaminase RidA (YjgF/YER057c/UK114 family)
MDNLEAILAAAGTSLAGLCKVNAYLTHAEDFAGFNAAYRKRLRSDGLPARATVVTALVTPPDVRIEIEAVAEIRP